MNSWKQRTDSRTETNLTDKKREIKIKIKTQAKWQLICRIREQKRLVTSSGSWLAFWVSQLQMSSISWPRSLYLSLAVSPGFWIKGGCCHGNARHRLFIVGMNVLQDEREVMLCSLFNKCVDMKHAWAWYASMPFRRRNKNS